MLSLSPSALIPSTVTSPAASTVTSPLGVAAVNKMKQRSNSISMDDTKVDYTSLLGLEDRKRRFSEDVVDRDTKDIVRLQKLYRQIQRQVHCNQENKGTATVLEV